MLLGVFRVPVLNSQKLVPVDHVMAEGKLTLHGVASSTCTGRVLVTLFEKGVEDFELKVVNVRKGEGKTPEHKSLQVR